MGTPPKPPATPDQARDRLAAVELEPALRDVLEQLQGAGHAAVLVGGAVRDVLLGRGGGDFDVASSATPDEVMGLFRRTIPTGVQHGTVTVLAGKDRTPVEVTTFRGEGAYEDGRRPTEVRFLRDLEEDLARRDFTVNALAWDPVAGVFTDPFGGLDDLNAGIVRAVGRPIDRFREDGLRTMRAVRFCATLEFSLDPMTGAAIPGALDTLGQVAVERIRVELWKLLAARRPSLGLGPMASTGVWAVVLPGPDRASLDETVAAVDALPADVVLRLARLLWSTARGEGPDAALAAMEKLRPSRVERRRAAALLADGVLDLVSAPDDESIRRAAAGVGREHLVDALRLAAADEERSARVLEVCAAAALSVKELAVTGGELMAAGVVTKGPAVGEALRALLEAVLEDPTLNEPERLLERARASG